MSVVRLRPRKRRLAFLRFSLAVLAALALAAEAYAAIAALDGRMGEAPGRVAGRR